MTETSTAKRSSDVPEQFYGYAVQLPRMMVHLLEADLGCQVCLEHIDDVTTLGPGGEAKLEQSKSSFSDNPVSDRALPFWKTLSNWVDAVREKRVDSAKTRFHLHVAQDRECGPLVAQLRDASTDAAALAAIHAARDEFWGAPPKHPKRSSVPDTLRKHVENIFTAPESLVVAIVKNMFVDIGSGDSVRDVRVGVRRELVSADQADDLVAYMLGWLQAKVLATIEAQEIVAIARDDFFAAMRTYVRKYDRMFQLAPWAKEPSPDAIDRELQTRVYVRQLDLIESDVDDKIAAAANFLKSFADRTAWSERGDVEPKSFKEFETHLQEQWKARLNAIQVEFSEKSEMARGKLLYARCQTYQAKLQSMEPSPYFTLGCFHALADALAVGWHPSFRVLLSAADKKAS
jgi:hypothetical protein